MKMDLVIPHHVKEEIPTYHVESASFIRFLFDRVLTYLIYDGRDEFLIGYTVIFTILTAVIAMALTQLIISSKQQSTGVSLVPSTLLHLL